MVLGSDESRHHRAQRVRAEHGLLTNDSLIVAACLEHDIRSLATRDSDFDQIPELTIHKPTDLT
jgi:predicted nucleic acid-binding protein